MLTEAFDRAASRARDRDAARGARLARDDLQHRRSSSSASAASRPATTSSSTGSTNGCRADDAPTREQTRARYPDESGYVERDGVSVFYEVYGVGRADGPAAADLVDHPLAHWKMQIPYLARHCRVITFDGRGQRPLRPAREARGYDEREFAADALAVMDATRDGARGDRRASRSARSAALLLAAEHPERVEGAVFIAPVLSPRGDAAYRADVYPLDERARHRRRLGEVQPPLLAARLPRLPRVLLLADVHRAALDEADRGLRRLGARDDARDAAWPLSGAAWTTEDDRGELCRARALPGARDPRRRGRDQPAARRGIALAERPAASSSSLEGSGHCPHVRDPVKVNLLLREFVVAAAAAAPLGARQVARASARSTSRRRSASATPSATPRSPTSCASSIPTSRSTGSRSIPVTKVLEARGERIHPGERAPGERVRPHRERVGRARPALLPGDPPDGRDPARELHGLPRPRPRRAVRPLDRRRGVGARLLPAREPRAEARRLRVADGLRRLAADGTTAASARRS